MVRHNFHDRFLIVDNNRCYLLGASIKDAGNKGSTVVPLQEPSIVKFILDYGNQAWTLATRI